MTNQDKRVQWAQSEIEVFSTDVSYYALSEQQISALLTAIAVIGWRTRWNNTEPAFYLEFGASLADSLMMPIDLCAEIAACIGSSTDVQEALQNNRQENGYAPTDPTYSERDTTKPVPSDTSVINDDSKCNDDQLFGQATELTDYMHAIIEDVMEYLEYAATQIEFTQDVTGIIPLFGKATEFVTGFAEWMFNNMANGYQAGYTQTLRDEIRCDLFCLMTEDCQLTFDELTNYFAGKASITVIGQSVEDMAAQLVNIVNGTEIVYAMHAVLAGILRLGGNWAGINSVTSLQTALALGADNPDNDWVLLCDPCTDECTTTPQQISVTSWTVDDHPCIESISFPAPISVSQVSSITASQGNPAPAIQEGRGTNPNNPSQYGMNTYVSVKFKRELSIDLLDYQYNFFQPINGVLAKQVEFYDENGGLITTVSQGTSGGSRNTWNTQTGNFNVAAWEVRVFIGVVSGAWNGSTQLHGWIDNLVITENGYVP